MAVAACFGVGFEGFESADQRLIARCLAGHPRAGRALVERLLPVIRARVRRRLGPHAEVDDLVQEIWAGLLADDGRWLRAWDPSRGASLENYVGLIAQRRTCTALVQARTARRGGGLPADELDEASGPVCRPSGALVMRSELIGLATHLRRALPERGWLVFRLHFTDGHEVPEVARALGVSAQVVYNWVFRIRREALAWRATTGPSTDTTL